MSRTLGLGRGGDAKQGVLARVIARSGWAQRIRPAFAARVLTILAALSSTYGAHSGALGQTLERIAETKTLRIGFLVDQAPFSSKGSDGMPGGYAIELCDKVADEISRRIQGVRKTYLENRITDGFAALEAHQLDLLCGALTITLGRREMVDFSQPIFFTGAGAVLRDDSPRDLRELFLGERTISAPRSPELHPFASSRVGARTGTTTETLLRRVIADEHYSATVVDFESHAEGLVALGAGDIDAYFADRALLVSLLNTKGAPSGFIVGSRLFTHEPYGIAMRRGDTELRLLVDQVLSRTFATPEFATLLMRYFQKAATPIRDQILLQSIPE